MWGGKHLCRHIMTALDQKGRGAGLQRRNAGERRGHAERKRQALWKRRRSPRANTRSGANATAPDCNASERVAEDWRAWADRARRYTDGSDAARENPDDSLRLDRNAQGDRCASRLDARTLSPPAIARYRRALRPPARHRR